MSEPTGHTIDGTPWAEPRPPHLPDPLVALDRRIGRVGWVFVVLAVIDAVAQAADYAARLRGADDAWLQVTMSLIQSLFPFLVAIALFVRHPNAWSTDRLVVIGVSLLSIAELTSTLARTLSIQLTAFDDDLTISLLSFSTVIQIVRLAGLVLLARGLLVARGGPLIEPRRTQTRIVGAMAALAVVLTLGGYAQSLSGDNAIDGAGGLAVIVWGILASSVSTFAWAAIALVGLGRVGGAGARAWRLVGLGALAVVGAFLFEAAMSVALRAIVPPTGDLGAYTTAVTIHSLISCVGFVLVIAAFALGLPHPAEAARVASSEPVRA